MTSSKKAYYTQLRVHFSSFSRAFAGVITGLEEEYAKHLEAQASAVDGNANRGTSDYVALLRLSLQPPTTSTTDVCRFEKINETHCR